MKWLIRLKTTNLTLLIEKENNIPGFDVGN